MIFSEIIKKLYKKYQLFADPVRHHPWKASQIKFWISTTIINDFSFKK